MYSVILKAAGEHNIYNSLGVLTVCDVLGIDLSLVVRSLSSFKGIGRRLEVIGEKSGMIVIDDYAHHPTEIRAGLNAIHSRYPNSKVLAVIEPHSYSRTKAVLELYKGIGDLADDFVIAPIFKARDNENFGISEKLLCDVIGENCVAYKESSDVVSYVRECKGNYDIVVVMGAGKSNILAREILNAL